MGTIRNPLRSRRREGAIVVEGAVVLPALLLLLLGLVSGGIGIFRYQQMACLAREAVRCASVHGANSETSFDEPPLTLKDLMNQVVVPRALGLDLTALSVNVQWIDPTTGTATDWDSSTKDVQILDADGEYVSGRVRATVVYRWLPSFMLGGIDLRSVAELPMSN